jgi:hypothetical protein
MDLTFLWGRRSANNRFLFIRNGPGHDIATLLPLWGERTSIVLGPGGSFRWKNPEIKNLMQVCLEHESTPIRSYWRPTQTFHLVILRPKNALTCNILKRLTNDVTLILPFCGVDVLLITDFWSSRMGLAMTLLCSYPSGGRGRQLFWDQVGPLDE